MDFILNGQAQGDIASALLSNGMDAGVLRPYRGDDGKGTFITMQIDGKPRAVQISNATASLRKDDWKLLDQAVVKAAKPRLKAVADLLGMGLQFNIPNGMSKTVLETESQSDISGAEVSMDGLRQSNADQPYYELTNLPLPIIHKDFDFSARHVAVSRNSNTPLDVSSAELAGRRCAETAEQMLIGTYGSYAYGGGTIYGYTNFPSRLTKTMTSPEASGWVPKTTLTEVLEMKDQAVDAYHYGPYKLYASTAWDVYLDGDYSDNKGDNTLRERLEKITGIESCETLDYLSTSGAYVMVLVQMTSDVVREVVGMNLQTVQWETKGGMQMNFKVMMIMVPQLRADYNGNTGIVHGTV